MSAMPQGQPRERPEVRVIRAPELGNSSFLVADPDAGDAIVIDPFRDIDRYLAGAEELGVKIGWALDTHLHNDFVSGCRELAAEVGSATAPLDEGAELAVGRFTVRALRTPGHTPTHLSYLVSDDEKPLALFSGGALMVGAIARTDLFGPHLAVQLALEAFRTLKVRLHRLPDEVAVYPTHGGGSFCGASTSTETETTMGQERRTNPFLTTVELMPFLARALHQGRYPDYYRQTAELNLAGPPLLGQTLPSLARLKPFQVETTLGRERRTNPFLTTEELMPFLARALHQGRYPDYYRQTAELNRVGPPLLGRTQAPLARLKPFQVETLSRTGRAAVIDLRPAREYDHAHLPGSFSIGIDGPFSAWVGWVVDRGRPLVLVGGSAAQQVKAQRQLLRIGYDRIAGALDGGVDAWREAGLPVSSFETAEIEDLAAWVLSAEPMTVVDTRDESEWTHGHVPGAVHLYVPDIAHHAAEIPRDAPVAVHCASGYRAGIAASILEQSGFSRIIHVAGPWSDWDRLHLATDSPG